MVVTRTNDVLVRDTMRLVSCSEQWSEWPPDSIDLEVDIQQRSQCRLLCRGGMYSEEFNDEEFNVKREIQK